MPTATKPFFRFTHSKALRVKTLKVLKAIDEGDEPTEQREALCAVIHELTEAGMQFFFLGPLKSLKMGFVVDQAAGLGVNGVLRILGPTIRNIVGRMNAKQLRQVSKVMREMMV